MTVVVYTISVILLSEKNTQNGFDLSNYYKKVKIKLKATSNDLSPYDTLTRPGKFRQNSKKNTCIKINISILEKL